jgi:hypothetical protein
VRVNEFHQARVFVLDAMVMAILVIEPLSLSRGGKLPRVPKQVGRPQKRRTKMRLPTRPN